MWRRSITHEQEHQRDAGTLPDGPGAWDYFLLYRKREPGQGFEVLAVRSIYQVASLWVQMERRLGQADADADLAG